MIRKLCLRNMFIAIPIFLLNFFISGVVNWNGITVNTDVYDDDINITNSNLIEGAVHVGAETQDVVISVNNDSVLQSDASNPGRLYFHAGYNRVIALELNNNLDLKGNVNAGSDVDFLVTFSGQGRLSVLLNDNKKLSITEGSGGTKFLIWMNNNKLPEVLFDRVNSSSSEDVEVYIGSKSMLSFIAPTTVSSGNADELGWLGFNSSNNGSGRMILRVDDNASFVLEGHHLKEVNDPVISDIDFSTPAGHLSILEVLNLKYSYPDYTAGLLVVNHNTVLSQLLSNYWKLDLGDHPYTGDRKGFVVGANGMIIVSNSSYFDYVGTASNIPPNGFANPDIPESILQGRPVNSVIKPRNPSAMFIDGNQDSELNAQFLFEGYSGMYFTSGGDSDGNFVQSFTVDPDKMTDGAGNIVLDIEDFLSVVGDRDPVYGSKGAINIKSLQTDYTGGQNLINTNSPKLFPLRTFAKNGSDYLRYNKACFLINGRMLLWDACLVHDDENHTVVEKNDILSEPAYIGGETFKLDLSSYNKYQPLMRPKISFYASNFRLHSSAALAGVDLFVPNDPMIRRTYGLSGVMRSSIDTYSMISTLPLLKEESSQEVSRFLFYSNGRKIDNGTGRQLILGTEIGATAADGSTVIDQEAHLDIFQEFEQSEETVQQLDLLTDINNNQINENISYSIDGETSVHTPYLGHASNISIGTNGEEGTDIEGNNFPLINRLWLPIKGNYFSFESRGGTKSYPELSGTTGEGGIFVDKNGFFSIDSDKRANISTFVSKSRNGVISLPKNQVFFDSRIGIGASDLDLSDVNQRSIVLQGDIISDYTLDWIKAKKDFDNFIPYEIGSYSVCSCPPVTQENVSSLPRILGKVDQFQIKRSRLGNQAHIKVSGIDGQYGLIKELVFLSGYNSSEAPVGVVVLDNYGEVGIGSAKRNTDSVEATVVLGVNGVSIIADGSGVVRLNEDIIVNNRCHVLKGPNFKTGDKLIFYSDEPRVLRVYSDGIFDLSQFTDLGDEIIFAGEVKLILDPGAKLILNGCTLKFTDKTVLEFGLNEDTSKLIGSEPSDLDDFRSKLIGNGRLLFGDYSLMGIYEGSLVGVEAKSECEIETNLELEFTDNARFEIGNQERLGGFFQIGNASSIGIPVAFKLTLNGLGVSFDLNSQGFMGMGVGIVNGASTIPNEWGVRALYDVQSIEILIRKGKFRHNKIYRGDTSRASLLAVGPIDGLYSLTFGDSKSVRFIGGGNIIQIPDNAVMHPIVMDYSGDNNNVRTGIMCSEAMLRMAPKDPEITNPMTPDAFFDLIKLDDYSLQDSNRAVIFRNSLDSFTLGYIDGSQDPNIVRSLRSGIEEGIYNNQGVFVNPTRAANQGDVLISLESAGSKPRKVLYATETDNS